MVRQGRDVGLLKEVLDKLADNIPLEESCRDHGLSGKYKGCRECHIQPDWLLIYQTDNDMLYLYLMRTGSHAELF
ncbi:MAG: type II toxin-antitoxin system YafQ family toxin [Coriobacteriia bacterium]|nr:type II toxin-antitoxin system YafQ family toxin [Coriobacteriia bacterium]